MNPVRVALAGLGTVGGGVVRLLEANADLIARRAGRPIAVHAVSARERTKDRRFAIDGFDWHDDMAELATRDDIDVVVELIGGSDGPALALARRTLAAGKSFVTANKAMIAIHGLELAELAERHGGALKFEAAVAGGVPVVKGLREGIAANTVERIYGILNGTCNYILSAMEDTGADFDDTLKRAQDLGYAEADPGFDIDGVDAAHKLAILAAIGFGSQTDFDAVSVEGIRPVRAADIAHAAGLGFAIRLIGMADLERRNDGSHALLQRVRPCLVPAQHPLASIDGPINAVVAEGDFSGRLLFQGAGAGDGPTASAVVADLIDLARGDTTPSFSVPTKDLVRLPAADAGHRVGRAYLRFTVTDKPGVLAELTAAMRDGGVSIESMIQQGRADQGSDVLVVMVTHDGPEECVTKALDRLKGSNSLTSTPLVMPILKD